MKNLVKVLAVASVSIFGACSIVDLEGNLENPNAVGVTNLDVNLLHNKIQQDFAGFISDVNVPAMELSRQLALTGGDVYERSYQPQSFNGIWSSAYQNVLIQIETLLSKTDGTNFSIHTGSAQVLKAYVLLTLVDMFGDIPYSEALKGSAGNFNPKVDSGRDVYAAAIGILDAAIANLAKANPAPLSRDVYYGGSAAKWTALANTLKLKAYMNTRLVDATNSKAKVEELLTKDLIDTDAEEFTYKYAAVDNPPSRHPFYRADYQPAAGSPADYISNYFMYISYRQKGVEDPRWRYYFYRQVGSIARALQDEPKAIPCIISPRPSHYGANQAWCSFEPGFFGRDHGNSDGIPPDQKARTCYGVYPAGGRADVNSGDNNYVGLSQQGQGANGTGIEPIWMANFTDFLKAEAMLSMGVAGDAKATLLAAVNKSINRVRAFATTKGQTLPAGMEPSQTDYVTAVTTLYDNAGSADAKLNVYAKEFLIALWGNGIEAYNMYRRLGGKPSDIQPMRSAAPGNFVRSFLYPSDFIGLNSTGVQKPLGGITKVFWDNNADAPFNK